MTTLPVLAADWLLTCFAHASVASGVALILGRWISANRSREVLWKTALLVPLATSLISSSGHSASRLSVDVPAIARRLMPRPAQATRVSVQTIRSSDELTISVRDNPARAVRCAILSLILIPAVVALTLMVRRRRRYWHGLRARRPVTPQALGVDPDLLVLRGHRVQLSVSASVESAAVIGHGEVCVSSGFSTLPAAEKECVIAHEVAHVERGDVLWAWLAEGVACLLAAQPLVRKVVSQLRREAEFICDEAAVRRIGDTRAYVRALIHFAAPLDDSASAPGYADSIVVERAERILVSRAGQPNAKAWTASLAAAILLALLLALPRFRTGDANVRIRAQLGGSVASGSRRVVQVMLNGR